ncbi:MAG: hypothetical protein K9K64_14580 [Desulfohalobiaceae bacterium]|nr:hypothetical protein [Desulfohalobiaceae bacterium]
MNRDESTIKNLLVKAIDLHIHSKPDLVPRKADDITLAKEAAAVGMSAIMIKCHHGDTAARAALANIHAQGIRVYGGIALNMAVGGLNPSAVETSLRFGGKAIWMPTLDAANHRRKTGQIGGIRIVNDRGGLKPEIHSILNLIKEHNAILATGHLSLEEIHPLLLTARQKGIEKLVVTHPEFWISALSIADQKELLPLQVTFERCFYASTLDKEQQTPFEKTVEWIKVLGHESTVLSSDLGQKHNISPIEGLKTMLAIAIKSGLTEQQIKRMLHTNPNNLLN